MADALSTNHIEISAELISVYADPTPAYAGTWAYHYATADGEHDRRGFASRAAALADFERRNSLAA